MLTNSTIHVIKHKLSPCMHAFSWQQMLFIIWLCLVNFINAKPPPIIVWHGMGDTCCNPLTTGFLIKIINKTIGPVDIYSVQIGNSFVEDFESDYFSDVNDQIDYVCNLIKNDTKYIKGYNSLGFSQGAQFLRGLIQRCPVPAINFVSIGGQHQGVYGLPKCPGNEHLCDDIRRILNKMAYDTFVQKRLVQSQYWHDPFNEQLYRKKSNFLADINQERGFNSMYRKQLLNLNKMVLVKFANDTIVQPKESEWFGFYKENSTTDVTAMEETDLYKNDLLGLKQLKEAGKLDLISYPDDHVRFNIEWFINSIVLKYFS